MKNLLEKIRFCFAMILSAWRQYRSPYFIFVKAGNYVHKLPMNDIKKHKPSIDCWCNPFVESKYDGKIRGQCTHRVFHPDFKNKEIN